MRYRGKFGDAETCIPIDLVSDAEMDALHEWLGSIALSLGLDGPPLDEAVAGALSGLLPVLQRERSIATKRLETPKVVE